jgi:UDP-2,3-diacylglucosamine hydrolase
VTPAPAASAAATPAAHAAETWSAAFVADLHLAASDAEGVARAVALVELCAARTPRLYVLGDLFDLWVTGDELSLPGFAPLFEALRAARARGLEIHFLAGNRDFNFLERDGARCGVTVHAEEELPVALDGRRLLLLHGDQLLLNDVGYQKLKRVVRGRTVRWCARHLPRPLALWIGRRVRRYSASAVARKDEARFELVPAAVRARLDAGADALLCGHVHVLQRVDYGAGRELLVLPPFFEESRFVVLARGKLEVAALDGTTSEPPPARPPAAGA